MKLLTVVIIGLLCCHSVQGGIPISLSGAAAGLGITDVSSLERTVEGLMKDGLGDPNTVHMLSEMTGMINNDILPDVVRERNDLQREIANLGKPFEMCKVPVDQNQNRENLKKEHEACRVREAATKVVMNEYCGKVGRAATRYFLNCSKLADISNLDKFPSAVPEKCAKGHDTDILEHMKVVRNYFRAALDKWDEIEKGCKLRREESEDANRTCYKKTIEYRDTTEECTKKQRLMDDAFCTGAIEGDSFCNQFDMCWATASSNFANINASAASILGGLESEYEALKRIECYLNILNLPNTTELNVVAARMETCRATYIDMRPVKIQWLYYDYQEPRLPKKPECTKPQVQQPGTAMYAMLHYDPLPVDAPADECLATCCQFCKHFKSCPPDRGLNPTMLDAMKFNVADCCMPPR